MRIAFVAHSVNRRQGVPRCVAELVARFSLEHDVTVFAESIDDLGGARFRFVKIPSWRGSRVIDHLSFLLLGAAAMRLLRYEHAKGFEIVHSTVGPGLSANVVTWHFYHEAEWRLIRKGVFPSPNGLPKLQRLDYNFYRQLMRWQERRAFSKMGPAGLIVVSEQMKRDVLQSFLWSDGSGAREIFVIPNAVDCEEFHPRNRDGFRAKIRQSHGIPAGAPLILFVGGDWERKGLAFAIASLAHLPKEAMLLVVGTGSVRQYMSMARRLGVADSVIFAGASSTVAQYYAAGDVLILPALYEPFGLVVTEAMASGLPVVMSKSVGASFLISNGVDAFAVENPTDEYTLAENLQKLLGDEELRRKVGEKARLTAEKLSWNNVAHETMKVYERVLSGRTS